MLSSHPYVRASTATKSCFKCPFLDLDEVFDLRNPSRSRFVDALGTRSRSYDQALHAKSCYKGRPTILAEMVFNEHLCGSDG